VKQMTISSQASTKEKLCSLMYYAKEKRDFNKNL